MVQPSLLRSSGHAHGAGADDRATFTIRDLAGEFDITARTLRFYEEKGLLSPQRRGLERLYSRRDRARLALVILGRRVGFSLEEIGVLLDLYDVDDGRETQLAATLQKFDEKIADLMARRADLDRAISDLKEARESVRVQLSGKQKESTK